MHFSLGTEEVGEDEWTARFLTMQIADCSERLRFFQSTSSSREQIDAFQTSADEMRQQLRQNRHFRHLPGRVRETLLKGKTATVEPEERILDRMFVLDEAGRAFLGFISSHAELSPLSYSRTGDGNRGLGVENDIDKKYLAIALDLSCEFVLRAASDMRKAFQKLQPKRGDSVGNERLSRLAKGIARWEGGHINEFLGNDAPLDPLMCSDCFQDEGLRLCALRVGQKDLSRCLNCGSQTGLKLSKRSVALTARQFFVRGSITRPQYGGAPVLQINNQQTTSMHAPSWLNSDLRLIEKTLNAGIFHYGPRMWMVGEVEPLKALQHPSSRADVIEQIIDAFPGRLLGTDECFYRLRKAPEFPGDFAQYDAPPPEFLGQGRFDSAKLPVLYGSQDLEVCVHECRVTAEDELFLATLVPKRTLRLLDLAEPLWEEAVTEFESLDLAVHMLFLATQHSYPISRDIAIKAHESGFDGLVYPSYFTLLRTGSIPFETTHGIWDRRLPRGRERARQNIVSNLALFGRPISEGTVSVKCINRVALNKVDYLLSFGPLLVDASDSTVKND
jgi:hypothetical protein